MGDYLKGRTIKNVVGETYVPQQIGSPAKTGALPVKLGTYSVGAEIFAQ